MALTYFRPRGDIKTNWETINPILKIREMGIEWDTEIGVGRAKIKFGDGATAWNDLDYAINIDESVADAFDEYSQSEDSPFVNKNIAEINNNLKIIDQDKNITQTVSFTGDASTSNEKSILSLSTNHGENGVVIRGVASPEEDSDVTNKKYVDDKTSIANTDKVGVVKESEEIAVEEDGAMKLGKILDKYGVVGEAQQSQLLTDIIDVISNKVMNDLMSKSLMSSVQTNSNSTVPTSGLVYNMNQQISGLNANYSYIFPSLKPKILSASNKRYLKIIGKQNQNFGSIILLNQNGFLCVYVGGSSIEKVFESTGNRITYSADGASMTYTFDFIAPYAHTIVIMGGGIANSDISLS